MTSERAASALTARRITLNCLKGGAWAGPMTSRSQFIGRSRGKVSSCYDVADELLGEGCKGKVMKAVSGLTGALRAVKVIPKDVDGCMMDTSTEIAIQEIVDHPNVVKLYETFEDTSSTSLVMELCEGGDVHDWIAKAGPLTDARARIFMRQLLSSVHCLQEHTMKLITYYTILYYTIIYYTITYTIYNYVIL